MQQLWSRHPVESISLPHLRLSTSFIRSDSIRPGRKRNSFVLLPSAQTRGDFREYGGFDWFCIEWIGCFGIISKEQYNEI